MHPMFQRILPMNDYRPDQAHVFNRIFKRHLQNEFQKLRNPSWWRHPIKYLKAHYFAFQETKKELGRSDHWDNWKI